MMTVPAGYDQRTEDELLAAAGWDGDLDRLFAISAWAGCHDPTNALLQVETNAIGLARSTWDGLGGFDEGFRRPGGGLANLELFTRYATRPGALNIALLGEATFHQHHGGIATANGAYFEESLREHLYVTGRPYRPPAYTFLADLGIELGRLDVVTRYWGLHAQ
jgi:hypothetical protein